MAQSVFLILDDEAPPHIVTIAQSFVYLLKRGPTLVQQQQVFVRSWLERRRRAVKKIEEWWLEIIHSPFTETGQRYIANLAITWKQKYIEI